MSKNKLPKAGTVEIAPSILSADFGKLADEIAQIEAAGIKIVHLDVMDGHFVPNISIGPPVIAKLRKHTDLFFDSHLMITEPGRYAEAFIEAGVDHITFHIEVEPEPEKLIDKIYSFGCTAGITLNPKTPVSDIEKVAPLCDMVLVMTVQPGFGGQSFMADAAEKIKQVRLSDTTPIVVGYGADTLVAGNAIFGKTDRAAAIKAISDAAQV